MKKKIIVLTFLLLPFFAGATINQNLYYGMTKNSSVKELQQFLLDKGFSTTKPTGNFYTATKNAVKKYQVSKNINATGYVGAQTRIAINADMSVALGANATPAPTITTTPAVVVPLTGSLNLIQNPLYGSQTILAPQTKFKLADFSLTNNTTEVINVNKVETDFLVNSSSNIVNLYLSNIYLGYGNNKTLVSNTLSNVNYFLVNFQLAVGQTIDLSIYGDISSYSSIGTLINSSILVSGVSAVLSANVFTNSNATLSGQNITIGSSSLTIGQDSGTPPARTIVTNQKIVAGKFQFTSVADSYNISELGFVVPGLANSSLISNVALVDTATQKILATSTIANDFSSDNSTIYFRTGIPVDLNSSKSVTLYYDLSNIINSKDVNINIAPVLKYIRATNSGGGYMDGVAENYSNFIASYNNISLPSAGVTVNPLYVYKSLPTFTLLPSSNTSISDDSNINLYKFSIAADKNGDVSVKQLNFIITISDPNNNNPRLANFSLLKNNTDYSGSLAIGIINNNNFIGLAGSNSVGGPSTNNIILTFNQEEIIPAGKTQTYTLKAYVTNLNKSSTLGQDTISTYLPTDPGALSGGYYLKTVFSKFYFGLAQQNTDQPTVNYYNLLWSDMSQAFPNVHNNFNGLYTNDWYNGYNVLGLPLSSQSVVAQ